MTPLQEFSHAATEARKVFESGRDAAAWLVFYEAKQTAYAKLAAALPQVTAIDDFWRFVQNRTPVAWLPIIEREVQRIIRSKHLCCDCWGVAVTRPERRCSQCRKARRLETCQKAKQRARAKQAMRKCPVCNVEPLMDSRQRVCLSCRANARRERNRRYRKSLKEQKLRRVQPDFTREGMSTVTPNGVTRQPRRTVDSEGVLVVGGVAS